MSQTGGKYLLIFPKIDEWLRFTAVWVCSDDEKRAHYVLHVKWNETSV